jgi:hypothetical protein
MEKCYLVIYMATKANVKNEDKKKPAPEIWDVGTDAGKSGASPDKMATPKLEGMSRRGDAVFSDGVRD